MVTSLDAAYASCEHAARSHYENFPVASLLVPAPMRRHIAALYAFARAADDFADEGSRAVADRHRLLDGWKARLNDAATAPSPGPPPRDGEPRNTVEIFLALGNTIRSKRLPVGLFDDLLSAFAQDVTVTRYAAWDDVLDYSRRSANPVGRLVLRIAGYDDPRLDVWSDDICSALQLTNFWQDLKVDFDRGRIYLPGEEMAGHGAAEADLAAGRLTRAWRAAMAAAVSRTRAMFLSGRPLCGAVAGRLKHELRATWLGGMRVLSRIEGVDFDVVASRPSLGTRDVPWLAWNLVTWAARPEGGPLNAAQGRSVEPRGSNAEAPP
jgi:hydroxysqualene synthase